MQNIRRVKFDHRKLIELSDKARNLIDGKNFGNLAFVTPSGEPHVSPVWLDREGNTILINAAEIRIKVKQLKEGQKVMLSITNQRNPYEKVLIRGKVSEITKEGALDQNDRMSMKYLGTLEDPDRPVGVDRVLIKIEPYRLTN